MNGERDEVYAPDGSFLGYYLVATVDVAVQFAGTGGAGARLDIQRANPCSFWPDVPCGSLFFARTEPSASGGTYAWPAWTGFPDPRSGSAVFAMPDSAYQPGAGNLALEARNGVPVSHQIAVWIDESAPPGPFRTEIRYTATVL